MRCWRWVVFGLPVTSFFCNWGGKSQAADILLEFEAATIVTTASEAVVTTAVKANTNSDPDAYLLSFTPPQTASADLVSQYLHPQDAGGLSTGSVSVARSSDETPLRVPKAPIPASQAIATAVPPPPLPSALADLFVGKADSLVARAVGNAEGTRTPDGQKTFAYYGHVDPGNRAWNQGTFSYQQEASSPEEADQRQLDRLKRQAEELHRLASSQGLHLTREEVLNGIDLANQSPAAALDQGYIDWLAQAKTMGLSNDEAILWARTRAFLDPDTGQWNAPGLGNSVQTIAQDQARRQQAIAQTLAFKISQEELLKHSKSLIPKPHISENAREDSEEIDIILLMNLPRQ